MSRLALGVGCILVVLAFAAIGDGSDGDGFAPYLLLVVGAGGVLWVGWTWYERRRPARPEQWASPATSSFRPASAGPTGPCFAVPRSLARVEVRELTTSPAFGVGLGFCALSMLLFGEIWVADFEGDLPGAVQLMPILAHPLAGMVVLAAFRSRTRGRRDGVEELFETCPTSEGTRTVAHLLTAWAPTVTALVFLLGTTALVIRGSNVLFGELGARELATLLTAAALATGATALGVALARWVPWTIVPIACVIGIGFATAELASYGTRTTDPLRQLSLWLGDPEVDVRLTAPHWLGHSVWILALVAIVTVLAILRDHRSWPVVGAGVVAIAIAASSGIVATRPIDASEARRIAVLLTDPSALDCADAVGLQVCTFPADDDLRRVLAEAAEPVAAAAAAGALDGWQVRQTAGTDWTQLDPEVLAITGERPPDDNVLPITFTGHPLALEGLRLWTGLAATGVFDDRWVPEATLSLRGQARGVVAIWLATRGADQEAQLDLTSLGGPTRSARNAGRPWPDSCYADVAPVVWAATDVAAARALVEAPEAEVQRVVHAEWARWVDRKTTTDDLLVALGLPKVGIEGSTPSPSEC